MSPAECHQFFIRLQAANPAPTTELVWQTPFQLLLSVLLSAQSTDVGVNRVTAPLYATLRQPQDLIDRGLARFEKDIQTLGLYRSKARHALDTAQRLVEQHEGQVPREREALEALPGVGRKTANVVLNTLYGDLTLAVDTHVLRVAQRTGLAPGKTPRAVEDRLMAIIPAEFLRHAHHWLILLGRYVCRARQPQCPLCPVRDLCLTGKPHV